MTGLPTFPGDPIWKTSPWQSPTTPPENFEQMYFKGYHNSKRIFKLKLWTEKIPELSFNIVDVTSSIVIPFLGSEITKV